MKKYILFLAMAPLLFGAGTSNQANFFKGSLNNAKLKAANEGKLIFVEFVANYCYLCKLMDETTWKDGKVIAYTDKNYVLMQVNVDDFDGFALKNKFNIKVLPTMLIFNSQGILLGRHEESMGSSRMMEVLKSYDKPENKVVVSSPGLEEGTEDPKPKPVPAPTVAVANPKPEQAVDQSEISTPPSAPDSASEPDSAAPSGSGLFEFTVKRVSSKGFGVQIGVFGQYGNVLKQAEELQSRFSKPVLVNINSLEGKTVYRVMIGGHPSKPEAQSFLELVKGQGYNGLVKDLSQYQ